MMPNMDVLLNVIIDDVLEVILIDVHCFTFLCFTSNDKLPTTVLGKKFERKKVRIGKKVELFFLQFFLDFI